MSAFAYDESLISGGEEGVIFPKCIVKFRPHTKWKGEYGFDWLREGDTNKDRGDNWFKETVGKHYITDPKDSSKTIVQSDINSYDGNFKTDSTMYQNLERTYKYFRINWKRYNNGSPFLYAIPMLTLMEGKTAKLKLKIEIEELPKKVTFKFKDEDAKNYLSLKNENLTDIKKGKYVVNDFFEITCKKAFDKEQTLLVYADDLHCGAIKIHPNTKEYHREIEVILVRVKTKLNSYEGAIGEPSDFEKVKTKMNNILKQALIKANVHYDKSLYVYATEDHFKKDFAVKKKTLSGRDYYYFEYGKKNKADYDILSCIKRKYELTSDYDKYRKDDFTGNIFLGWGKKDIYTIFFLDEYCIPPNAPEVITSGIGGYSPLPLGKVSEVICFKSKEHDETVIHELLHALGLTHTFDGKSSEAKYTYQGLTTDNLMDYSHHVNIERNSLFLWQWQRINKKIKYEK